MTLFLFHPVKKSIPSLLNNPTALTFSVQRKLHPVVSYGGGNIQSNNKHAFNGWAQSLDRSRLGSTSSEDVLQYNTNLY